MGGKWWLTWLVVLVLSCGVAARPAQPTQVGAQSQPIDAIRTSCATFNPYFVTSSFARVTQAHPIPDEPAIIAFRDTPDDADADKIVLATQEQVGAVYGLAYDPVHERLYAGAYHKRSTLFGAGGPGQIYEVDLATGAVRPFVRLSAGPDRHDYRTSDDEPAAQWVGRAGLGDLEVDDSGTNLFAVNLSDSSIYRIALPAGTILGSFRHGEAGEPWIRNAQVFGLGYGDGWLYHAVEDTRLFQAEPGHFHASIFRSRPDGTEMKRVAALDLSYPRGGAALGLAWQAWDNWTPDPLPNGSFFQQSSQPIVSDIEVASGGDMIVGLRDRMVDMLPVLDRAGTNHGAGDLLLGEPVADGWNIVTDTERLLDLATYDEASWGGVATIPGFDVAVSSANAPVTASGVGAIWNWLSSGQIWHRETIATIANASDAHGSNGLGDVESLCGRSATPDPAVVPTATSAVATATEGAKLTATVEALTPTVAPTGTPQDFDRVIAESCLTDNPYAGTVCYPFWQMFQPGLGAATIVTFRDTPADNPIYPIAYSGQVGAVWGLAYASQEGAMYASAFHKRLVPFGPSGTGAIYRLQVRNGRITTFAVVPDTGPDVHSITDLRSPDNGSRDLAGKLSLGDLDLSDDERTLFVMNLNTRLIYRYDVATGSLLGSFAHGAASEPWAEDARPFALKYHDGRLYHGVVNSAESSRQPGDLVAYVYESAPDGSGMRRVATVPLDYDRGTVRVPGVLNASPQDVPLAWLPWRDGENDLTGSRAMAAVYPQPMLTDIEFMANGDMVLGLRDRFADMAHALQITTPAIHKPGVGFGDVLLVPRVAGGWGGPVYDHFHGLGGVGSERAGMGGLARMLRFDVLLADRVAFAGGGSAPSPYVYTSEDVLWFDGAGNQTRIEQVCQAWGTGRSVAAGTAGSPFTVRPPDAPLVPLDNEYVPSRSLGDVEVLCGLTPEPSYTPPPTRTATRTATPSRTPAPTVTATSTPTQTPRPGRIYLPMAIWGPCNPEGWYSDVALVIDLSTSMARPTGRGRSKILATIEAAKWFVDHMAHLDPDPQGRHEQVAVAGFNSEGWIEQGLTNDRRSARAGLDRLPAKMREYTRLDLAVTVGAEATGSGHLPDNHRVVILLTDGLPNQVPLDPDGTMETTVLKAAAAARAQDVSIYTIAIGTPTDTNPVLLQAMSSGPGYYYYMPDPEDLEKVYDEIYGSIPCPRDGFGWPGSWP